MSEEKKGTRDISDLKARLGLKKGATGGTPAAVPAVSPAGTPAAVPGIPRQTATSMPVAAPLPSPVAVPPPAGIVPPPGAAVPPPPGFPVAAAPAPAPAPAPPPDPRRDPFGAAAPAMYNPYYAEPLPGTDDGKPVEQMNKPKPWGRIALVAGIALGGLVVGNVFGRISAGRADFNQTTDDAQKILDEARSMQKKIEKIGDEIKASPNALKGNPDVDLAAKLGEMVPSSKPDFHKLFHTNYYHLEDLAIDRLFTYYNDTIHLYELIELHAKKTENDKDAIGNFVKSGGKGDKNYGVVFDTSKALMTAKLVELGAPKCANGGNDCNANELKGFQYRMDSGGSWAEKPVKGAPGAIVTPVEQTGLFKAVASGNPDILAARDHVRRQAEIVVTAAKLGQTWKELESDLKRAAERPHLLAF